MGELRQLTFVCHEVTEVAAYVRVQVPEFYFFDFRRARSHNWEGYGVNCGCALVKVKIQLFYQKINKVEL